MLSKCLFVCCSDAPLDIRIKSNLVADLLSLTGTGNRFMFCSPTSVLHVALWRGLSLPCGSGRLLFIFIFLLQSPCAGIVVQDPYTGEIQGQEKATRQQSRTVRSHLLQFKSYTITIFSPSIFPLSSPSISPSPLPPSPPLLSEKAFLWWVECRTGGHSEGVERRICQKRRLCKNISYRRLLGALWVRGKWSYHQLSCPRDLVLLMSMTVW